MVSCNSKQETQQNSTNTQEAINAKTDYTEFVFDMPYRAAQPSNFYQIEKAVPTTKEFALYQKGRFAFLDTVNGRLLVYNAGSNSIEKRVRFSRPDAFTAIAINNPTAYALRKDGIVFRFNTADSVSQPSYYRTSFNTQNGIEGADWDIKNNRLLIIGRATFNQKPAILAFDAIKGVLLDKPVLVIDTSAVIGFIRQSLPNYRLNSFEVSDVAFHPITNEYYVLSNTSRVIVRYNEEGALLGCLGLDPRRYNNPTSLSFDTEGNLYLFNVQTNSSREIILLRYSK